jgi:parallel beta-helix repeat protein
LGFIKFKRRKVFLLGLILVLSSIITINLPNDIGNKRNVTTDFNEIDSVNKNLKTAVISEAIHIHNNWSATKSAGICTGNGIYSDPYVIEDFVIDGGGSRSCILIESSTAHFIILNCTIFNSGGSEHLLHGGIHLSFVSNGRLINNTCYSNTNGILLAIHCTNNIVKGNNLTNNDVGINTFYECNFNTFSFNNIVDNYEGVSIDYNCLNNNILDNIAIQNSAGILIAGHSHNIRRNICNNNVQGINLLESNHNTISGNTASFNTHSGIRLSQSSNNAISGNSVNNNTVAGLYISYESNLNTISGNHATNNEYGIYLISNRDNTISGNYLGGNEVCVYEDGCQGNEFSDNSGCNYGERDETMLLNVILLVSGVSVIGTIIIIEIRKVRKRKSLREIKS